MSLKVDGQQATQPIDQTSSMKVDPKPNSPLPQAKSSIDQSASNSSKQPMPVRIILSILKRLVWIPLIGRLCSWLIEKLEPKQPAAAPSRAGVPTKEEQPENEEDAASQASMQFTKEYAGEFATKLLALAGEYQLGDNAVVKKAIEELKESLIAYRTQKETTVALMKEAIQTVWPAVKRLSKEENNKILRIIGLKECESNNLISLSVEAMFSRAFQQPPEESPKDFLSWASELSSTENAERVAELLKEPYAALVQENTLISLQEEAQFSIAGEIIYLRHKWGDLDLKENTRTLSFLIVFYHLLSAKRLPSSSALKKAAEWSQQLVDKFYAQQEKRLAYEGALLELAKHLLVPQMNGEKLPESLLDLLPPLSYKEKENAIDKYPLNRIREAEFPLGSTSPLARGQQILKKIREARITAKTLVTLPTDRS